MFPVKICITCIFQMATAKKLDDHFLLTCTVCHEIFTDPSTLSCGHSFCGQCIVTFTKTRPDAVSAKSIPCPFCWRLTRVPDPTRPVEEWAGQMNPPLVLKGLLDTFGPGAKGRWHGKVLSFCSQLFLMPYALPLIPNE